MIIGVFHSTNNKKAVSANFFKRKNKINDTLVNHEILYN